MLPILAALGSALVPQIGKVIAKIASKPVVKIAASAAAALGAGAVYSSATSSNLPALPASVGSMPMIPGVPTSMMKAQSVGTFPMWRGAGGKMQLPWNDPNIPQMLRQFSLDDAYLRQAVRAPRGYVVVRDASGRPYAVERSIAIKMRIWRPAKKAPISAGEWNKYKTSQRVAKKLLKIAAPEIRRKNRSKSATCITKRRKAA